MGYKVHTVDGEAGEVDLTHARTQHMSLVLTSPADGTYVLGRMPVAATITRVSIHRAGGSAGSVQITNAGNNVLSAALASSTGAWATTTTLVTAETDVAAGASIAAVVSATAGSPTGMTIQVDFTVDVP